MDRELDRVAITNAAPEPIDRFAPTGQTRNLGWLLRQSEMEETRKSRADNFGLDDSPGVWVSSYLTTWKLRSACPSYVTSRCLGVADFIVRLIVAPDCGGAT
jgi:hypothetical protein